MASLNVTASVSHELERRTAYHEYHRTATLRTRCLAMGKLTANAFRESFIAAENELL